MAGLLLNMGIGQRDRDWQVRTYFRYLPGCVISVQYISAKQKKRDCLLENILSMAMLEHNIPTKLMNQKRNKKQCTEILLQILRWVLLSIFLFRTHLK